MEDYELEEKLADIEKMNQALQIKQQRDFNDWRNRTIADELQRAAEELDLKPVDIEKHFRDPNYERDLRKSARKLMEKAAKRVKTHGGGGRGPITTRSQIVRGSKAEEERPAGKYRSIKEAKAAVDKGAIVSDDDLMDLLPRLL